MKKILFKLALLTICLTGFIASGNSQITINADGYYEIKDPGYSGATYSVYAWVEVIEDGLYPCTNPGNPFISNATEGYHWSNYLQFGQVYPPNPEPMYPYRIKLVAVRNNPYGVSKAGYSDWASQYGLSPW